MTIGDKVLIVDDDRYISDLLATGLKFSGFHIETAFSGTEALSKARLFRPDLILMDVMLPDFDGTDVCRKLRDMGDSVPVLFLTASDSTENKIEGLALGDDYVTKPFSLEEVLARVNAILRRVRGEDNGISNPFVLNFADLTMDIATHEVWRQGNLIDLTATEFNLLQYLLEHARHVISKQEILDNVWESGFSGDPNIVETYVSYLRKKVDECDPPLIHTIRGVGYSLRLPPTSL